MAWATAAWTLSLSASASVSLSVSPAAMTVAPTCDVSVSEDLTMPTSATTGSGGGAKGGGVTIPPLPPPGAAYDYALDDAFVMLPTTCVVRNGLTPDAGGQPEHDPRKRLWVGRWADLEAQASGE